jgi:hypothetical protein
MKRSCKVFILLPIVPLLIAGCMGVTPYQEADSKGYGVKTYKMSENRYKVVVKASRKTDKGTAEGYFWRRAQDLCGCPGAAHGDLPFADHIEGCLRLSNTIRIDGHPEKVITKRVDGSFASDYKETTVHKEEDTEVSGEVECLKESK